ncbi:sialate O-acetylesterase [Prosthecobacter sp.]|uniref:sialate O-acetylesterase n=1 Tax=Prosthecobacter sp. TaxID=1965333 RepID=UPI002ABB3F01|nr:sialate O-acetylesterase [Prosthecobacter sp.]MDZ4403252.1 sialate O-acetylesterase [Prosthecobacter sp.]
MKSPARPHAFIGILLCCLAMSASHAEVRLPALFSDHMVFQQDASAPVWGWASAGEQITVSIEEQAKTTTAGADGRWQVKLDPLKSSEPLEMIVKGTNTLSVKDVLAGETWLCAGQSNMVMTVSASKDYEKERAAATLPQIRMFTVADGRSTSPQSDCHGSWIVCSPEAVGDFSAVAFYFGRELHQRLGSALGLINSSAGGTLIESWLDLETQQQCAELKPFFAQRDRLMAAFDRAVAEKHYEAAMTKWKLAVEKAKADKQPLPKQPSHPYGSHLGAMNVSGLFNGKIAPLIPYALRGIVWYQGESNCTPERSPFYETQMRLLVTDWRARWGSELPFAWVQLPNVRKTPSYADIREVQMKCLDLPKTGMAITIDIGESRDLHPKNKQDVGRRLALWVLGTVCGEKVSAISGPLFTQHEVRGSEIVLRFRHTEGGLMAKGGELKGFLIAGANRAWKPAVARIEGDTVIVSAPNVPQPVAVRYAWAADPVCNLFNGAGLPASPFRTDDWETTPPATKP